MNFTPTFNKLRLLRSSIIKDIVIDLIDIDLIENFTCLNSSTSLDTQNQKLCKIFTEYTSIYMKRKISRSI